MNRRACFVLSIILLVSPIIFAGCNEKRPVSKTLKENVTITDMGTYYQVVLDFDNAESHREIGEEFGSKILQMLPQYESLVDSYLKDTTNSDESYKTFLERVNDIKPQVDSDYRDEIEGMASKFSGLNQNVRGDGKVSLDELYMMNLFPDVARGTQCSALSVYGERSVTKHTMTARILDWFPGSKNELAQLQAVTTFNNSNKSICTIGYLGFIGVISGFNNDKVFAAILDSGTGETYSSESKRSYPMDIRNALENNNSLDDVGNYLRLPERSYAFNHLIFLSDSNTSKVLENNISKSTNSIRDLRTENSVLNEGIEWGLDSSIGSVNSFLLKGNFDNHSTLPLNTTRWDSMKKELKSKGNRITQDQLKEVACYFSGNAPGEQYDGDLYNIDTQQIIIFEPYNLNLQVMFRPKSGILSNTPLFEKVPVIVK